jgi:hypothetical protein
LADVFEDPVRIKAPKRSAEVVAVVEEDDEERKRRRQEYAEEREREAGEKAREESARERFGELSKARSKSKSNNSSFTFFVEVNLYFLDPTQLPPKDTPWNQVQAWDRFMRAWRKWKWTVKLALAEAYLANDKALPAGLVMDAEWLSAVKPLFVSDVPPVDVLEARICRTCGMQHGFLEYYNIGEAGQADAADKALYVRCRTCFAAATPAQRKPGSRAGWPVHGIAATDLPCDRARHHGRCDAHIRATLDADIAPDMASEVDCRIALKMSQHYQSDHCNPGLFSKTPKLLVYY